MNARSSLVAMVALCAGGAATACVQPPPPVEPPMSWWSWGDVPGVDTLYVSLGDVFVTSTDHNCACGIGLGSTANPLPTGVDIHDVRVGILNKTTHEFTPILPFDLLDRLPGADGAWAAGPAGTADLGQPIEGSTWFGFGGLIPPVDPGMPGADECFVICFDFWIDPGIDFLIDAQIGGGLGDPNNGPLFDPSDPHSSRYSGAFTIRLPAPGSLACAGLGLLAWSRRRR